MKVGDYVNVEAWSIGRARIINIRPLGTIDVQARNGRCFRISGLALNADVDALECSGNHPEPERVTMDREDA